MDVPIHVHNGARFFCCVCTCDSIIGYFFHHHTHTHTPTCFTLFFWFTKCGELFFFQRHRHAWNALSENGQLNWVIITLIGRIKKSLTFSLLSNALFSLLKCFFITNCDSTCKWNIRWSIWVTYCENWGNGTHFIQTVFVITMSRIFFLKFNFSLLSVLVRTYFFLSLCLCPCHHVPPLIKSLNLQQNHSIFIAKATVIISWWKLGRCAWNTFLFVLRMWVDFLYA